MADLVRVAAFPSAGELALHAADARGLFADGGLAVEITGVRGSREQFAGLREGRWDVLHTAADNVLAYRADGLDVIVVAGVNRGLLSLVAREDVRGIADLRGRPIGVDSAASGYAVVLRHVLALAGFEPAGGEIVEIGGTRERAEALADGRIAATLLTPPYDVRALRAGAHRLLRPTDHVPRYAGASVTVERAWAQRHRDVLVRYLGALLAAGAWLRDPAHRDAVFDLLADRMGVARDLAGDVLDAVLDPASGLVPGGRIAAADLDEVMAVRRRAGQAVPGRAADALDLTYLPAAS